MNCLVTGGCGFIGIHLIRHLLSEGHQVLNIDCLSYASNPAALNDADQSSSYHFLEGDIANPDSWQKTFEDFSPHRIFHLAAETHVDRSIHDPSPFLHSNILGTFSLLETVKRHLDRFPSAKKNFLLLHVSTDEVFGQLGDQGHFTEDSPYQPRSPYSATKAASDHLVQAWQTTYGIPAVITRSSNNYGPHQHREKFIPTVITMALSDQPIPIYGNGAQIRDWIYVGDHVHALELISNKARPGETYNIGASNEFTNLQTATRICETLDLLHPRADGKSYLSQLTFVADRPGHDFRYSLDTRKLHDHFDWHPATPFASGLATTIRHHLPA